MKEGCHSDILGDAPRGRTTTYVAHPWSGSGGETVTTHWNTTRADGRPMTCGIQPQAGYGEPNCKGCANYPKGANE